ncbi:MAG: 4Fe-4S dicluster domain-containing protein [Candidatus Bathyarchaeia archaeon]|jgi:ferredoxin
MPEKNASAVDIFDLLSEDSPEQAKKKHRQELLEPTGVKELFEEGKININKFTCAGVQCKLCVKACPTNALYWKSGEVGVTEDLCVYCGACVANCMVDDCIKIERKRKDGKTERFSKPQDIIMLEEKINAKKRFDRVKAIFPTVDAYCEKCPTKTEDSNLLWEKSKVSTNSDKQKQHLTKPRKRRQPKHE